MRKHHEIITEETEEPVKVPKRVKVAFGFGIVFFIVALASTFSFSAILWKADITWVENLFDFFIFSFLFITYAAPTAIIASVLSAICFIGARKNTNVVMRKAGIVFFILDFVFLISAIIVAVQLA